MTTHEKQIDSKDLIPNHALRNAIVQEFASFSTEESAGKDEGADKLSAVP